MLPDGITRFKEADYVKTWSSAHGGTSAVPFTTGRAGVRWEEHRPSALGEYLFQREDEE